jgi:hypothetical protein
MLRDVLNTIVFITKTQFVIKHTDSTTANMPAGVGMHVYEILALRAVSVSTVTTNMEW